MTADAKVLSISDFNLANFRGLLENDEALPKCICEERSLASVPAAILETVEGSERYDVAFVWTRPEQTLGAFRKILEGEAPGETAVDEDVRAFADLLTRLASKVGHIFVASWTLPPWLRSGPRSFHAQGGVAMALARSNVALAQHAAATANIHILDASAWTETAGVAAWSEKLWYVAKVPFANSVLKTAVAELKAVIRIVAGQGRKLLVLDLDDTLWGGIIGDDGISGIRLGGHDPVGEAHRDFQLAVRALKRRGVILGLVSKNEESVALEAIRNHPEMVLKLEDFAGWRINWRDKAENIAELAAELRLGLQSVVFIDDNPFERARVREAFPEVLVPEWPESKLSYVSALHLLKCFDSAPMTEEDKRRTELYQQEKQREDLRASVGSAEDWLASLKIEAKVERLTKDDIRRAAQLLNKTNQLNMRTRRMTEDELWEWANAPGHALWTVRVSDRFGDAGLTGIVSLAASGERGEVADFILSCRVMGRKVEETMIAVLAAEAARLGLKELFFELIPTAKNKPCLDFLQRSGLESVGENQFVWPLRNPWPAPAVVALVTHA